LTHPQRIDPKNAILELGVGDQDAKEAPRSSTRFV
jgi:hypothetical protein